MADNFLESERRRKLATTKQPDEGKLEFARALFGTPAHRRTLTLSSKMTITFNSDGCVAQSRANLYGPRWDDVYYHLLDVQAAMVSAVMTSAEVKDAQHGWSACMLRAGYSYPSMDASRGQVAAMLSSLRSPATPDPQALARIRTQEVAIATADAACQQQSGITDVIRRSNDRVTASYGTQMHPLLQEYDAMILRARDAASKYAETASDIRRRGRK